jgi:hypothetical protein
MRFLDLNHDFGWHLVIFHREHQSISKIHILFPYLRAYNVPRASPSQILIGRVKTIRRR